MNPTWYYSVIEMVLEWTLEKPADMEDLDGWKRLGHEEVFEGPDHDDNLRRAQTWFASRVNGLVLRGQFNGKPFAPPGMAEADKHAGFVVSLYHCEAYPNGEVYYHPLAMHRPVSVYET